MADYTDPANHTDLLDELQEQETWKNDLARLEEEIRTLKSVLATKEKQAYELKKRLGITPMAEFRNDINHGFQVIKLSDPVQKTNEKIHQIGDTISSTDAYQKTNAAFKSFGSFASKKLGDIRNSGAFKSVEGRVGGMYSSVKQSKSLYNVANRQDFNGTQFSGSQSTNDFQVPPAQQ